MKTKILILLVILSCILITLPIAAHSGRTDSNGGHYDNSTGTYHYHHGYPAHRHYDMDGDGDIDCPYLYKSGSSGGTNAPTFPELPDYSWINTGNNKYTTTTKYHNNNSSTNFDFEEIINVILIAITLLIVVPIFLYWMYGLASLIVEFIFPNFDQGTTKSKIILILLAIVLMVALLTIVGLTD